VYAYVCQHTPDGPARFWRFPMIPFTEVSPREVKAGDMIAASYKTWEGERWVRTETVRKVTRHRDGSTTIATDPPDLEEPVLRPDAPRRRGLVQPDAADRGERGLRAGAGVSAEVFEVVFVTVFALIVLGIAIDLGMRDK
jgi:hypothetical protein